MQSKRGAIPGIAVGLILRGLSNTNIAVGIAGGDSETIKTNACKAVALAGRFAGENRP